MAAPISRGFHRSLEGDLVLRRKPDLFLSHSSRDKKSATEIAHALTNVGVDVFLDSWELEPGDSLHRSLAVALAQSRRVAIVISSDFSSSEWCLDELSQALAREKQSKENVLVPLLLENVTPPPFLADRVYIDFGPGFFPAIVRLAQFMHGLSKSIVLEQLKRNPPTKLRDVAEILEAAGWNNTSLFDEQSLTLFKKQLSKHRISHDIDPVSGAVSIDFSKIDTLRRVMRNSHIAQALIELWGDRARTSRRKLTGRH
jgi:TIR domain